MKKRSQVLETVVHGVFLLLGLITVGCVLLISVYLIVSGIPAIRKIGLVPFLFGKTWASTAAEPSYGILPFILTSVYGTAGAIVLGVPLGFLTAVYLAKVAPPRLKTVLESAVSLLAGIPSVVYGLVGMLVLVPGIRKVFHLADGASLLAAIVVLAIMILPSIIKVSVTALEAVPPEYEDASLALGATPIETYFKVSVPAAKSGIAAAVVLGVGHRRGHGRHDGVGKCAEYAEPVSERALSDHRRRQRNVLLRRPAAAGAVFHRAGAVFVHHAHQRHAQLLPQAQSGGGQMKKKAVSGGRRAYILTMRILMGAAAIITAALVLFLIAYVLIKGLPNVSWTLLSTAPSYLSDRIGILPDILNTLYIVIATLLIVLPLGVGAAIYLTEYATNRRLIGAIEYAAETLSGIPSIIYGLVGMLFFCQFLNMKTSLLAGALTLVIMNLPTIMRTTQESLKTVPQSYREGAFGLGAGKWRVIRTVVLPGCVDGVITGCILSVGRILGESAALLFTAGFAHALNDFFEGLSSAGATLTVALYVYAKEQGRFDVAFAIAAILMILTLLINGAATLVERYFRRKRSL